MTKPDRWDGEASNIVLFQPPSIVRDDIAQALRATYAAGLERAAEIAEEQQRAFLDPQYACPQPMGSIHERFACSQVANAIRAEKED